MNFFATGNFLKHSTEGFFYEMFRYCETKQFRRKIVNTAPSLISNIFRYPELMEHKRIPLQNFSALWDKKFLTENLDTPPSLLSINFFATGNFLKHSTDGFFNEIFRQCETKDFWQKSSLSPPFLSIKFFETINFVKHKRVPLRNDSVLWDKTILSQSRDYRPLFYP